MMQVLAAKSWQEEKNLSLHALSITAVVKIRRDLSKCNSAPRVSISDEDSKGHSRGMLFTTDSHLMKISSS